MKNRFATISIHIIAWTLLFIVPYLTTFRVIKSIIPASTEITFVPIIIMSLTLISIFYINYFILIPKYLLTRRYLRYALYFLGCIASSMLLSALIFYIAGLNPGKLEEANPLFLKIRPIVQTNAFLMLIISFVASISLVLNNQLKQTEKERLSAQISSLKSQINPHFLFNVLNSIYAVTLGKSPQAAEMVDKLSGMMRYSFHEAQEDFVPLEKEIQYIENYIDLQKVRFDDSVKLEYTIEGTVGSQQIAPLLFIPFVENAFKHGVNSEDESDIRIKLRITPTEIHFEVDNKKVKFDNSITEKSGIGISNTKHRLELIYPSKHLLSIQETETDFHISLHINLA